jgi:hypothetical protein
VVVLVCGLTAACIAGAELLAGVSRENAVAWSRGGVTASVQLLDPVTVALGSPAPTSAPTPATAPAPTGATGSKPKPGATPRPAAGQAPAKPKPQPRTVTVASIRKLLQVLADDSVDVIVVKNGTYHVSASNAQEPDSLWIDDQFAKRTRPIIVRAESRGGVIFDGAGGTYYGGLSFSAGAHDQTWDGFTFANMEANETGIVEVGGYVPSAAPHHITLRNITVMRSCLGRATVVDAPAVDHAFYISNALAPGPHDLTFENITVDGRGGLASAFHFDHQEAGAPNASGVTVRRLQVTGTQQAIIMWVPTLRNIRFDTVDIRGALSHAIRYESIGSKRIVFAHFTSRGTGGEPFFSSQGDAPPGVSFVDEDLR